jgi:hypothetical protein
MTLKRLIQWWVLINLLLGLLAVSLETVETDKTHTEHTQTSMPMWDWNPRSQCWSGRKQFVPQTARPLRSADHRWRLGCQPYAPTGGLPQKDLLVFIPVQGSVYPRAIVRLERLVQLKKIQWPHRDSNYLPACSIAPQPFTLPRVPIAFRTTVEFNFLFWSSRPYIRSWFYRVSFKERERWLRMWMKVTENDYNLFYSTILHSARRDWGNRVKPHAKLNLNLNHI